MSRSPTTLLPALLLACLGLLEVRIAFAQGFAAAVSPPRFELSLQPGERVRQVVEISNPENQSVRLRLRTADWLLDADAGLSFFDALHPGSCRPWVAIEAREITVPPSGKYRYRFEIEPPADTLAGECRFALLIEGGDQPTQAGALSFPVTGRIGIIVYATVGDAQPKLEVMGTKVAKVNDVVLPVIEIRNSGNAHGRVSGFLSGTDASGKKLEFEPSTLPILPGELRGIFLSPNGGGNTSVQIAYPITIKGTLEWGDKNVPFEQRFAP
jgi:hypothetical protein